MYLDLKFMRDGKYNNEIEQSMLAGNQVNGAVHGMRHEQSKSIYKGMTDCVYSCIGPHTCVNEC